MDELDGLVDRAQRLVDEAAVEVADEGRVAELRPAGRDGDVRRRQRVAAEDEPSVRQLVADRVGPDGDGAVRAHQAPASETERDDVGHAEVRSHVGDLDLGRRLARKAVAKHADIRRRPADVDDHGVARTGDERAAAHAVRRPGREREHRVLLRELGRHQRSVVLADVERRGDPQLVERDSERADDGERKLDEARIHDRRVLAFEQPDPPDLAGEGHVDVRNLVAQDDGCALLHLAVHGSERRGERHRSNARVAELDCEAPNLVLAQRRDLATVELVPAVDVVPVIPDRVTEVLRPVDHRRQRLRRRKRDPDRSDLEQVLPFDDGVREVRGADHHGADILRPALARAEHLG